MRIILATDAPWSMTANARQMAYLAECLRDDLHTVYWMPTTGLSAGGRLDWNGITVIPGDDLLGNEIIKYHVRQLAAQLVITRGTAGQFPRFGGSEFAWWAWHPDPIDRKILRKAMRNIAVSHEEARLLEAESGVWPTLIPRTYGSAYKSRDAQAAQVFRANHGIARDAYLVSAIGPNNPHWKRMIDAFKLFHDKHPDAVLYMHTEAQRPMDLIEYAESAGLEVGDFVFPDSYNFHTGYYDETVAAMYRASDVHLVPGLSVLPILESLASGTPVLATDHPEAREIMQLDGLGALVKPVTWHEHNPMLDVEKWAEELENAYRMTPAEREAHGDVCRMMARPHSFRASYEEHWKPLLLAFEQEESSRWRKKPLEGEVNEEKRDSRFLEELGFVEEFGCEVVRKTVYGGAEEDEEEANKVVQSWGNHPNLITFLREGHDEYGRYYFDTPKLTPLMSITNFTPKQSENILADVRAGLSFMHEHGAAHCDINPRNILLTDCADGQMTEKTRAVIFDFDFMKWGLKKQLAAMCDFDPTNPFVMPYAVPIMQAGISTRGYHRIVTYVKNLPYDKVKATSTPDMPYQAIDGVGERDCDERWEMIKPDVKGKRVLDLGCNMGYFSARSLAEGATSVEGYDRDEGIIETAVVLHPELKDKLQLMDFDAELPTGDYDVAFCLSIWQHTRDGKRPMLELLKRIPVVYWEDANLNKAELEHMGFRVERLGRSERGRNLFKLESVREAVHA